MAIANKKVLLDGTIQDIWKIITSLDEYGWRSDLGKIEVLEPGKKFVEYTKDGYGTTFTITAFEAPVRYEFDMENDNMKGHWTGLLKEQGGRTAADFTEDVTVKKWYMKPFVGGYLKNQQAAYFRDLEKALRKKRQQAADPPAV